MENEYAELVDCWLKYDFGHVASRANKMSKSELVELCAVMSAHHKIGVDELYKLSGFLLAMNSRPT